MHIVGEVALGFPPPPNTYRSVAYANTQPDAPTATWLTVRPDGSVTAYAGKVEYGQGIRWGLAVEVAEELRAPLESVEVVLGDTGRVPWDMGTFGSQSTARVGQQLRKAAATARQALLELAADRARPASGAAHVPRRPRRRETASEVSYGELLAGQQITRAIDDEVALTPADEFSIAGKGAAARRRCRARDRRGGVLAGRDPRRHAVRSSAATALARREAARR